MAPVATLQGQPGQEGQAPPWTSPWDASTMEETMTDERHCPQCDQPEKFFELLAERSVAGDPYYGEDAYTEVDFRCRRCGHRFTVEA
ncbi:hypothetical protein [Azospirillum argentinense]